MNPVLLTYLDKRRRLVCFSHGSWWWKDLMTWRRLSRKPAGLERY